MLLDRGANPNMQLKLFPPYRSLGQDRGGDSLLTVGTTPLIRAAKAGDNDAVKLLLARGAMADLPNNLGVTPLMAAAGIGWTTLDIRGAFPQRAALHRDGQAAGGRRRGCQRRERQRPDRHCTASAQLGLDGIREIPGRVRARAWTCRIAKGATPLDIAMRQGRRHRSRGSRGSRDASGDSRRATRR